MNNVKRQSSLKNGIAKAISTIDVDPIAASEALDNYFETKCLSNWSIALRKNCDSLHPFMSVRKDG